MKFKNPFKKLNNSMRKKNWSAPAIITVFIIIMMILVYSFEQIGLLNKERNLDLRLSNPESIIKTSYRDLNLKVVKPKMPMDKFSKEKKAKINESLMNKIDQQAKKTKEEHIKNIRNILIDGAISQIIYEVSKRNNDKDNYYYFRKENFQLKEIDFPNNSYCNYFNNKLNENLLELISKNRDNCGNNDLKPLKDFRELKKGSSFIFYD